MRLGPDRAIGEFDSLDLARCRCIRTGEADRVGAANNVHRDLRCPTQLHVRGRDAGVQAQCVHGAVGALVVDHINAAATSESIGIGPLPPKQRVIAQSAEQHVAAVIAVQRVIT